MLNVISTCQDILCVDINVDKRCVDHNTNQWSNVVNYALWLPNLVRRILDATLKLETFMEDQRSPEV